MSWLSTVDCNFFLEPSRWQACPRVPIKNREEDKHVPLCRKFRSTMLVKVLFFASARDATGGIKEIPEFEILPTPAGQKVTTKHLIAKLEQLFPALNFERDQIAMAVNQVYVTTGTDTLLTHGDEVALLPPISGG